MDEIKPNDSENYLTGVKSIAGYMEERLGRSVTQRTVYRWMMMHGLPYRKLGGWVVAKKDELDSWMEPPT